MVRVGDFAESGEGVPHSKAKGYAIHNLYQDAEEQGKSHLITDYPVDFFWGAFALEAGIIIPSAEVQQALVKLYRDDKAKQLCNYFSPGEDLLVLQRSLYFVQDESNADG